MGCWSKAIMGGDGPYDWMGGLLDKLKVPQKHFHGIDLPPQGASYRRARLGIELKILERLWPVVIELEEDEHEHENIGWMVLGVILMRFGVQVNDALVGKIIEEALLDEWAQEDDDRCAKIVSFIDDLLTWCETGYIERELSDADQGLIATCMEHLAAGKTGMVNV